MDRIASGLAYPVGVAVGGDGGLIIGEAGAGRVSVLGPGDARRELAAFAGAPLGVAVTARGDIVVCDNGGKFPPAPSTGDEAGTDDAAPAVYRVGDDGTVATLLTEVDQVPLAAPNGVCLDGAGGVWFADSAWHFADEATERGSLCYIDPDGAGARFATEMRFPAGVALDAAGSELFVAEAMDGGLWAYRVLGPGVLGPRRLVHDFGRDVVPSGLAFDRDGLLLVSGHQSGRIHVVDPSGTERATIDIGRSAGLGQMCFGGDDLATLYVTAAATGDVYALTWTAPGLPLRG